MTTTNTRLGIAALALSGLSLVVASIAPDGWKNRNEAPHFVSVVSLAEKIKTRENLQLIDIRPRSEFEEFHLPTAINIPLDDFPGFKNLGNAPVVVYSGDDWLARRLWNSLNATERMQCTVLYGGASDWYNRILYPQLPLHPVGQDSSLVEQVHELTQFYGGFAEFVQDPSIMNYYKRDWFSVSWPKPKPKKGLKRKGC